jgi:hypothetical protein
MIAIPSSYRDPCGFVFKYQNQYLRAISNVGIESYQMLMSSGLYTSLTERNLLISHQERISPEGLPEDIVMVLQPKQVHTISYAWEWSFTMLKDAAICTLQNAVHALSKGMVLKDANIYNIQFVDGEPLLIDTLSFEKYREGEPWIAYRQFCEHFLAPLVLMHYAEASMNRLLQVYPDGIPLDICLQLLPLKARFNLHVYLHLVLQSRLSAKHPVKPAAGKQHFSRKKMDILLKGLIGFVEGLRMKPAASTWDKYYDETILSQDYLHQKKMLVRSFLENIPMSTLLDLGANDGAFTLLFQQRDIQIIAVDADNNCIERLYAYCRSNQIRNVLPLIGNLAYPSSGVGWNNEERTSLPNRLQADVCMALALIHHLAITHHIPMDSILRFMHHRCRYLLIEFVPKEDPKVQELLANRADIFEHYHLSEFKKIAIRYFDILREETVAGTERTLFLLQRKENII